MCGCDGVRDRGCFFPSFFQSPSPPIHPSVVGTAVVYARRFLFDRGLGAVSPPALAAGALFLAAKAEESHVSLAGVVALAAKASGEREGES